jgi:hypothetical protein
MNQSRIAHAALLKIMPGFGAGIELRLIELDRFLKHGSRIDWVDRPRALLLEIGDGLAKGWVIIR